MHIWLVRPVWLVYICIFRMPWNKICCPTMSFKKGNIREAYQVNLIPSVCKLLVCSCLFCASKAYHLYHTMAWIERRSDCPQMSLFLDNLGYVINFFWSSDQSRRIWVTFCVFTRRQWVRWLEGLSTDLPREGKFFPIVDPQQWNNVWLWWVAKTKTETRNRQRQGQKTKTREKDKDKFGSPTMRQRDTLVSSWSVLLPVKSFQFLEVGFRDLRRKVVTGAMGRVALFSGVRDKSTDRLFQKVNKLDEKSTSPQITNL